MTDLPEYALSIRQPWAWAIIHAGKDIENRDWRTSNPGLRFRGPVCIHASSSMSNDEFHDAATFIDFHSPRTCPKRKGLEFGCIIGTARIVDIVQIKQSPWFFGPIGLVLADVERVDPIPVRGQLGFFKWKPAEPKPVKRKSAHPDLFQ